MTDRPTIWRDIAAPLAGLLGLAALGGLTLGVLSEGPTDTALIERYAALYARDTGNPITDCEARPASVQGLRLYIVCRPDLGPPQVFLVNQTGGLSDFETLDDALRAEGST
ncbi:MAG: hypothetical protein AAFR35_04655 [Pseudomonadota bacterium]